MKTKRIEKAAIITYIAICAVMCNVVVISIAMTIVILATQHALK